jgi:hypothetical protein
MQGHFVVRQYAIATPKVVDVACEWSGACASSPVCCSAAAAAAAGPIPTWIGKCFPTIEELDLSNNRVGAALSAASYCCDARLALCYRILQHDVSSSRSVCLMCWMLFLLWVFARLPVPAPYLGF